MQWDDRSTPSIVVPLAAFFGLHGKIAAFDTLPMQVELQGEQVRMSSFLPMPFSSRAVLSLGNQGTRDIPVQALVEAYAALPRGDWAYLHADFRRANAPIPAEARYRVADIQGRGKFVGTFMFMQGEKIEEGLVPMWYEFLEGDEEIVIDGSTAVLGTGTEDYFNGGWYFMDGLYNHPFGALIQLDRDEQAELGTVSVLRWHLMGDAINFKSSLLFDFEYGPNHPEIVTEYASVAYYYLR